MDTRFNQLARSLWPYIQPLIEPMLRRGGATTAGGGATGGAPSPHTLNSTHHSGTLGDAQAPQFLMADGSRNLTGNLAVDSAVTIDGVDLSVHVADADAHHNRVTVGDGLDLTGQLIDVDVTDFIDTAYGLTESSNNIRVNLATDPGLEFATGALRVKMPTPSGITRDSTGLHLAEDIDGAGLTMVSKVLAVGAGNGISVATDAVAVNQAYAFAWTANHTQAGNVTFTGAARTITSDGGYNLTLAAAGDLILDPVGNVQLPDAQELRTTNFSDFPTGISGIRLWDRGSNYRQLTMGAIKIDELYARVFVADETRIDRGEEYWSKSFGVVSADWTLPADKSYRQVTFEDAPALLGANLFSVGDALLFRTVDWATGIVISKFWMRVHAFTSDNSDDTQTWHLQHITGGTPGQTVKAGNVALCAGTLGQGWVHLSALDQDGGPFIQAGEMTTLYSVAGGTAPLFTNYVRMGNLNGVGGIATDTWGFAAAKNLATSIGSGYAGIMLDPDDGLRLYDAGIWVKNGSGDAVLGVHGSTTGSISWGGLTLSPGDVMIGDSTVGGYLLWDDSATGTEKLKIVDAAIEIAQYGGGSITLDSYGIDVSAASNFNYPYDQITNYVGVAFPGVQYYYEGFNSGQRFGENTSTGDVDFVTWAFGSRHGDRLRNVLAATQQGDDALIPGNAEVVVEATQYWTESAVPYYATAGITIAQSRSAGTITLDASEGDGFAGEIELIADDITVTGDFTALSSKRLRSGATGSIGDDTATSIPAPVFPCLILVSPGSSNTPLFIAHFRSNAATPIVLVSTGGTVGATTGILAGTTGSDARVTVSVHTDNNIYIENRMSYGINYTYQFIG